MTNPQASLVTSDRDEIRDVGVEIFDAEDPLTWSAREERSLPKHVRSERNPESYEFWQDYERLDAIHVRPIDLDASDPSAWPHQARRDAVRQVGGSSVSSDVPSSWRNQEGRSEHVNVASGAYSVIFEQ